MRNKFFSVGMIVFLLLFIIACGSSKDEPAPTYSISGTVSGDTLAGVTINLSGAATATTTTDAGGNYSFTGRANGTYIVTPVKAGYIFNPVSLLAPVSGASVTGINFVATATGASTYSISGTVTGAAPAGVTINLTGAAIGTTTTNASGYYIFSNLVNGDYTVTPSHMGYSFTPANHSITLSGANSPGNDFTSAAGIITLYGISGAVTGALTAGVTINLTGTDTRSTTTNASGTFSFTGLANGPYTLTPVKENVTFAPSSSAATVSGADITGKNFVATINPALKYSIFGQVTGDVQYQVTITLSGAGTASTITNPSGNYSLPGLVNGSYTVMPSLTGYTFSPASAAANVSGADITGKNFVATAIPTTYTQADLTGTWRCQFLTPWSANRWFRGIVTSDSSGLLTLSSCLDNTGNTSCPAAGSIQWTINASGVISESGSGGSPDAHYTMTSNKNFIAGTGTKGAGQYDLRIAQKMIPETAYSNADLQNKTFVMHELILSSYSAYNFWAYATGSIGVSGVATLSSETTPFGTSTPGVMGTLSVDSNGYVTLTGHPNWYGFLAADKKTIVAIWTDSAMGWTTYNLMIIQITGQTYPAGALPAGISAVHYLAGGATAGWIHYTNTVASGGGMTFSDWVTSNPAFTAPAATTGTISASGTVLIAGNSSYHGQVSDDGKFTVGTQTNGTSPNFVYALTVTTH